jgi:hypothetical protein
MFAVGIRTADHAQQYCVTLLRVYGQIGGIEENTLRYAASRVQRRNPL